MANRYWVGGSASWDGTAGTKWSTTSGGAGGAAVPTAGDDVFFNAASGTVTVTVASTSSCLSLNFTGFTGTLAGTSQISCQRNLTLSSTMTCTYSGNINLQLTSLLTSAGKTLGSITLNSSTSNVTLQDALTLSGTLSVGLGVFTTNNYNVTASSLTSNDSSTRTINLGSSTVTLTGATPIVFQTGTGLTLNEGTSTIVCSSAGLTFNGIGQTFYNVSFTNNNSGVSVVSGANTFNNLSVTGRASTGVSQLSFLSDQIINGTLTLSAGTNATMRTFVRSDILGTIRTLTCASFSGTDVDFRDITIAGAAAPVSGTRLGDCKGNSGITFPSAKTVYCRSTGSANWSATTGWSATSGGASAVTNFPLAQDTAVFPAATYPASGSTITLDAAYNIGTIDMSLRTSNTMTLAAGTTSPFIYGNWVNGTGTTITGTGTTTYAGRGSQTITSAGKTFTFASTIDSPGGSVTLQDAFVTNRSAAGALLVNSGTFDANNYNVSLTGASSSFSSSNSNVRTIAIGSGTWTIAGTGGWTTGTSTNLTLTGTGTISLTAASNKTFTGGGVQTFPTINQGGTGTLTITGSNKFANITDTAIGRVQFTGGTTNEFTAFNLGGVSGNLLALGSTNTTQVTLKKPTAWNVGANSTNGGNNTGLSFTAGGNDYLNISYVIGVVTSAPTSTIYYGSTNVVSIYYGSTAVSAIYYGSTQVF